MTFKIGRLTGGAHSVTLWQPDDGGHPAAEVCR